MFAGRRGSTLSLTCRNKHNRRSQRVSRAFLLVVFLATNDFTTPGRHIGDDIQHCTTSGDVGLTLMAMDVIAASRGEVG